MLERFEVLTPLSVKGTISEMSRRVVKNMWRISQHFTLILDCISDD
jgi:hypothetical protein